MVVTAIALEELTVGLANPLQGLYSVRVRVCVVNVAVAVFVGVRAWSESGLMYSVRFCV